MRPVTVEHDAVQQRFAATLADGSVAELRYHRAGTILDFYHTFVPEAFRTEGVAEQVVLAGFQYARQAGYRVIPSCPYVSRGFLRRHPEFADLVDGRGGQ